MSKLKLFMGLEELAAQPDPSIAIVEAIDVDEVQEVTPAEYGDAENLLVEAGDQSDAYREELAELKSEIDQTRDAVSSLEEIQDIIAYGIESQEFSPQFAGSVNIMLGRFSFLQDPDKPTPSLEDYNSDSIADFYTVSNEAVSDLLKKLTTALSNMKARYKRVTQAMGDPTAIAKASNTRADALIGKLNAVKTSKSVELNVKFAHSRLGVQGTFPSDLIKACNADLANYQVLTTTVFPDMTNKATAGINHFLAAGGGDGKPDFGKAKSELEALLKLGLIDEKVTPTMYTGVGFFSMQVEKPEVPKMEGELKADLSALATYANGVDIAFIKTKQGPSEISLTKSQVKTLLENVKRYVSLFDKQTKEFGVNYFKQIDQLEKMEKLKNTKFHPAVNEAFDLVFAYLFTSNSIASARSIYTRHIITSLLGVCERAISALEKAD